MNKLTKSVFGIAVAISLAGNAYFFGTRWFAEFQQKAMQQGAVQMREAVWNAVNQGEVKIANVKGEQITIIKK